jgi:single-strand DNA-binding protein
MDDDYGSSAPAPRQSSGGAARPAPSKPAPNFSDMDDDIPF